MSFPKYEVYEDSGVEWLGEVPEHWEMSRVKFDSYVKARVGWHGLKSDEFTDEGPYLVTGSDFKDRTVDWANCYHCTLERYEQDPYIQLREGDLLITKDGTIGKLILVERIPERATLNSGIFVVRPLNESYSTQFYFWLLQSSAFYGFINIHKTGSTISHLYQETFENLPYALPPVPAQTQIARFLDRETACIDTLIAEQQRLIELLKEKRQAVISHAVTKGLDPTAPMKDSGVDWLGEVPEHWEISRIGWQCLVGNGCTPSRENLDYWNDGDYPWLNSSNVNLERIVESDQFVTKKALKECALPIVKPGSVLMAITGEGKTRGMVTITEIEVTINQHIAFIERRNKSLSHHFLHDWLFANYLRIRHESEGWGSTKAAITCSDIRAFPLPLPPMNEQEKICRFINEKLSLLNELGSHSEVNIRLLQERRSALISAAVTGKIDVRGWQAPASTSPASTLEVAHG